MSEVPAPITGRGRPTTTLQPHPRGPLVVAVDVRHEDWRCAIVPLDGRPQMVIARPHGSSDSSALMQDIAAVLARLRRRHGRRLRAVSVAVAGTVERGRLVQVATLGWGAVDLETILGGLDIPLLIGNDATLAGLAEARHGAGVGSRTVLHLTVEVGIGGVLVVDQAPVAGSSGAGGEYGHLPFGDLRLRCPCGARGCWDLEVDGRALARHLGEPPPADPRRYARLVLAGAAEEGDGQARRAVRTVAVALASGIAGLVNAHDPDVVTLGALAGEIRAVALSRVRRRLHGRAYGLSPTPADAARARRARRGGSPRRRCGCGARRRAERAGAARLGRRPRLVATSESIVGFTRELLQKRQYRGDGLAERQFGARDSGFTSAIEARWRTIKRAGCTSAQSSVSPRTSGR